ncbi:MAG TPA: PhzF family phenazine biosynthesis protein [Rhodanobacteraceae bacterium]|jgi:PhzF family phenazine biosynthesis protein|nr:PhzF family phenazine biosynthesis protein [Rhodanobacteraceae bacterium]
MSKFHYLQLDVFAASRGGGNPLGVVVDAREWTDADMQAFASWTNLVETTFLLPATNPQASYRLRIFTPSNEIPFAGHPTIGSAHAALHSGFAQARDGLLVQECGAGLLPIRLHEANGEHELFVKAPASRIVAAAAPGAPLRSVLASQALGALPPALVEGGRRWWVVEFADEAGVRRWQPDHAAIKALAVADNCLGVCIFARCANAPRELVVRAFPAGVGIVEDPASGAANGLIAAWIVQSEPAGALARGYRVSQGREIGHDASITVRIDEDRAVWVGGTSDIVIDGTLRWPLA